MNISVGFLSDRKVQAWLLMTTMIALHVLDEAVHEFLPFYNETIAKLGEQLGFSLFPSFTFDIWLGGLIVGILILYGMTPLVARGGQAIRVFSTILGFIMVANGLGHTALSISQGWMVPGTWSSPFLFAAAVFVVVQGFRADWKPKTTAGA